MNCKSINYNNYCRKYINRPILYLFYREKQLNALMRMYEENEAEMCNALASDLRKSKQESLVNEVDFLKNDLRNTLMHLREWAAPELVRQTNHT